jgi:hypothetical protein
MTKLIANYQQQKMDFLDNIEPNDLRNGESFNQLEAIIERINQGLVRSVINKENPQDFINKAVKNLFRENSPAIEKATKLFENYLIISNNRS